MKTVTLLAMQHTMASTVIGPMDLFAQAGVMENYFQGQRAAPYFQVKLVTTIGKPFRCLSGVRIVPDGSISEVEKSDLIVISSIMDIHRTLKAQAEVVDWLRQHYRRGAQIASICTGAFVLAETGLLNGKTATTHWAFENQFKRRYPQIELKTDHLITDEGDLYCAGGASAGIDLSLYLIEKYCGYQAALRISQSMLFDLRRKSQAPYVIFSKQKDHPDDKIRLIQKWIESNFDQPFTYDLLARRNGMSRRTLERRFKHATGTTPLIYQQRLRVEAAKQMLEQGRRSFDEITYQVGYEDSSTFRKVFLKQTGLLPTEYRQKFQRRFLASF